MSKPIQPYPMKATTTPLSTYRAKVLDAYQNGKIFIVFENNYEKFKINLDVIRQCLLNRGWLEKLPSDRYMDLQRLPEKTLLKHARPGNNYETVAISKVINNLPAFFVWQSKHDVSLYTDVFPYRSCIRWDESMDFSNKRGLISCTEQQQWFRQEGVSGMLYPRVFRHGGNHEEHKAFIDDFRLTQCRSLIKYLGQRLENPSDVIDFENSTISSNILTTALSCVQHQLDDFEYKTLEANQLQIPEEQWCEFLINCRKIIHENHTIKCTSVELTTFLESGLHLLSVIEEKRPDFKWDGFKNLWVIKPGYESRGDGIIISNNLDEILKWVENHFASRYIIQKYIENPLLIYRTKFDIRFYLLVYVRESVVQIWLYRECYLRFSTQEYNTNDLTEAIHLTNNWVQRKYAIPATRDPRLPKNLMWSLEQFKSYLRTQNVSENIWEDRIFTGIRDNLTAAVLASLDKADLVKNSFELYGCDFILDKEYNPILIEMNYTPGMHPSTELTAHLCPMVMKDIVKVVVDLPQNSQASTGLFQLAYEVNYTYKPDLLSKDSLYINGKSMMVYSPVIADEDFINQAKTTENSNNGREVRSLRDNIKIAPASFNVNKLKFRASKTLKAAMKKALALLHLVKKDKT